MHKFYFKDFHNYKLSIDCYIYIDIDIQFHFISIHYHVATSNLWRACFSQLKKTMAPGDTWCQCNPSSIKGGGGIPIKEIVRNSPPPVFENYPPPNPKNEHYNWKITRFFLFERYLFGKWLGFSLSTVSFLGGVHFWDVAARPLERNRFKKEGCVFQPSIVRCELLVSGRVIYFCWAGFCSSFMENREVLFIDLDVFLWVIFFTDFTLGFITMIHHHLENMFHVFQAPDANPSIWWYP